MITFLDQNDVEYGSMSAITVSNGVNGERSISGTVVSGDDVIHNIDIGWRLRHENEYYVVIFAEPIDLGDRVEVQFDAVHQFFYDFSKSSVYGRLDGSNTMQNYLNFIFSGSGYSFSLETNINAFPKENFGYKSRLNLFYDIMNSTDAEFVVNGRVVRILSRVGTNLTTVVKKGFNLNEIRLEKNIGDFITYKRGLGAFYDEEDESKGRLEVEYISPLAEIYGRLEGEPIVDERFSVEENLYNRLKADVDNSYNISVQIDMEDLTKAGYEYDQPRAGDYITAINEDLGIKRSVRIVSFKSEFDVRGELIKHEVTCNSLGNIQKEDDSEYTRLEQEFADIIAKTEEKFLALVSANGRNRNYYGSEFPKDEPKGTLVVGDQLWLKDGEMVKRYYWNGEEWVPDPFSENPNWITEMIDEVQSLAEDLLTDIERSEQKAEEALERADQSLAELGTIDTKISDLRSDLDFVGDRAESSLEIIGLDGGAMYTKNRRLGSKTQAIQPDDKGLIQHNGEGFEIGAIYTLSMLVSCLLDDVITWEERTRTEVIDFVRETQYRTDLLPEESFVQREGVAGTATYTWQIEFVNGEPTGNKSAEIRTNYVAPVNEIFVQGTKVKSKVILNFTADNIVNPMPITKSRVVLNLAEPGGSFPTPPVDPTDPVDSNFDNARVVNLADYGGVGDGSTDNFDAFDRVIKASISEPLVLQIDNGNYFVQGGTNRRLEPWPFKSKGLRIEGTGDYVNIYHKNNRDTNKHEYYFMQMIMEEDSLGFEVENILLDGIRNGQEELFYTISENNPIENIPMAKGISVHGAHHVLHKNLRFKNMYGGYGLVLEEYRDVSIQDITLDKVGGHDTTESFGMAIYISGHKGDAFINIDNVKAQGMVGSQPHYKSWIGITFENGTIQSQDPTLWLVDINTVVNITNSEFIDYHATYHVESWAGNMYFNDDFTKGSTSTHLVAAGVLGEFWSETNDLEMEIRPFGHIWGLIKGIYHTDKENEDNFSGLTRMFMRNSKITYVPEPGYSHPTAMASYGNSTIGNFKNVQLDNVPNLMVENGSAFFTDSVINLMQGNNNTVQNMQEFWMNDDRQEVVFTNTSVNPYGQHKQVVRDVTPKTVAHITDHVPPPFTEPLLPPI